MTTKSVLLARARSRRRSAGAAMFIVAITLGLLAAMGVYGLAATASDVRAAGHGRQAAQAQHAAELAIQTSAYVIQTANAQQVMRNVAARVTPNCMTARPIGTLTGDPDLNRYANGCWMMTNDSTNDTFHALAQSGAQWGEAVTAPVMGPFSPQSFGEVPDYAHIRVELTNPVDWAPPPGFDQNFTFTQLRATVRVEMRPGTTLPADSVATGRGRLVIGPYKRLSF
jgi:hypothetical protein